MPQWCNYQWYGRWCPHGCEGEHIVCHKWNRGTCTYHGAQCKHGHHSYPPHPSDSERSHSPPRPPQGSHPNNKQAEGATKTASESLIYLIRQQLDQDSSSDAHRKAVLRRMILAFHPDKVDNTRLAGVFTHVIRMINEEREAH